LQLDFLDSQTQLSLEQFQRDWDLARYGDPPGLHHDEYDFEDNNVVQDGGSSGKKRALGADQMTTSKKKAGALQQVLPVVLKKAKKGHAPVNRTALPPLREHPFGDLSRFAAPPKNPASSFMQFSRKYRAGKERGKAPNARHVSETWNQMTDEQKKPFVELAEEDKKRVQAEIDVYMAQVKREEFY
jgi:hypothetical protein